MVMKTSGFGVWGGDDAAGDPVAGVAGGVGLHVVRLFVDDDRGSSVGENAVGGGGVEGEVVHLYRCRGPVVFTDDDVLGKVAGVVAHGVLNAVLLVIGIEVRRRS